MKEYLDFDRVVPFREGNHYFESALQRTDGQTSKGMFGRAVRTVPDSRLSAWRGPGAALRIGSTRWWHRKHQTRLNVIIMNRDIGPCN